MCLRALFSSSLFPHCWLDSCAAHFARYEICILCSNYWHFNLLLLVSIHLLFIFIVRMRKWKLKLKLKYTHTHTSHRLYLPTLFSMWIEIARRKNSSREKIITKFKIKIEKLRQCDAICKSNRRMQTKHAHLTVAHKCYVQFFLQFSSRDAVCILRIMWKKMQVLIVSYNPIAEIITKYSKKKQSAEQTNKAHELFSLEYTFYGKEYMCCDEQE